MDYQMLAGFVGLGVLILSMFKMLREDNKRQETRLSEEIKSVRSEVKDVRSELGGDIKSVRTELKDLRTELGDKIDILTKEVHGLDNRMSNIEGQMTQMTRPQIIPMERPYHPDDAKEN